MSYQQYMNMGFGAAAAGGHPYMMGFQPGSMPMQMQANPAQYVTNHRPQGNVSVPSQMVANKSGKRKMNNDPNRPKRPTSAYFYFVQIEREEAAKRGEKITRVAEWTKQISQKWRDFTVPEKEVFQKMAAIDKARYTSQMQIYTGKDANRPKRPQSAYFLWLADFRARMKNKFIENKDILRAAGEEWRKLTTMAKAPYEQRAEEERRKYEVAMKEYNMAGGAKKPRVDLPPAAVTPTVVGSSVVSPPPSTSSATAAPYQTTTPSQPQPPQQQPPTLLPQQLQQQHNDDEYDDDDDDGSYEDDDDAEFE